MVKGNAIFECHVISYPSSQISWKKNNKKLSEHNKKFRIVHGSNVSFLRVTDASHSLNNILNLTCVAENSYGSVESVAFLHVVPEKDKPKNYPNVQINYPKSVEPDTLFRIECNITSLEQPVNVQWYQSNRPIYFDSDKYFTNSSVIDECKNIIPIWLNCPALK